MGRQVADANDREAARPGDRLPQVDADQQAADQPGPARYAHGIDLLPASSGFLERTLDDRDQRLQVGPGRQLRDDPAVGGVQRVLRADDVREQAWAIANHRRRGFITGCLDRQDAPGVGDYSGVLLSSPSISSVCMMSLKRFLKLDDWIESDHMTIASSLLSV